MDSLSAFDDLYTAIEACLIYPDEVIDRLARAFYPAILVCWNSEEGQREFAAWQAEQIHLAGKEKQEVPAGELPAVYIILVCGFWQGTSGWAHPVFLFLINKMEQIGQYDHSNNYSKKKHGNQSPGCDMGLPGQIDSFPQAPGTALHPDAPDTAGRASARFSAFLRSGCPHPGCLS